MKSRHYVITGLLAYTLFLVISTPAATIYHFSDRFPQATFQGLNGTLWNGSAQRVIIASSHKLDDVNWSLCAWRLLTGELCLELDASYNNNRVYGEIGAGFGGSLSARNLSYETDALELGNLAGLPIGKLSGEVSLDINSASWSRGTVPVVDGIITWKDASVTVAETANLGTVSIVLSESDDHPMTATINNKGGHVEIQGQANIIDDGTYKLELKMKPNSQASKNVRSSLEMFAKKQANGSFVLINSGNIEQFGLM